MFFAPTLAHYLYPRHSNNHKAKLLHASTLFFLALVLLAYQGILRLLPLSGVRILGYAANISPSEVISMTNQKRVEAGLPALEFNSALSTAAKKKGEDMLARDYWAHIAPDGTQPWKFFTEEGYNYRYAGENLARDFADEASAVSAWMASPSHRDNLLSAKYQEIGIAVVEGDLAGLESTIIVQLFGTRFSGSAPQVPIARAEAEVTGVSETAPEVEVTPSLAQAPQTVVSAPSESPRVMISPFATTKSLSTLTIVALLGVLVVDGIVVARRRISRVGGRTFAHLAFLGMVLVIVLIAKAGQIL